MTLREFRAEMDQFWDRVYRDDVESKGSYDALAELSEFYRGFEGDDRVLADKVISEWVLSEREDKRLAAMHLISDLRVSAAVPALRQLIARLEQAEDDPGAPFESQKAERIIRELAVPSE